MGMETLKSAAHAAGYSTVFTDTNGAAGEPDHDYRPVPMTAKTAEKKPYRSWMSPLRRLWDWQIPAQN